MHNPTNKVLVIAPHLDDEILGCGGVIAYHLSIGDRVNVCFIADRVYNHIYDKDAVETQRRHALDAQKAIGYQSAHYLCLHDERLDTCAQDIIVPLEEYVYKFRPEIVYSPYQYDNNQDHQAVAKAVQVVLRPLAAVFVKRWLMYETPSSTEQAPNIISPMFRPNTYCDIERYLETKLNAWKCYKNENRCYPHPRSSRAIQALTMKRGMEAGLANAEAFMLVREKYA